MYTNSISRMEVGRRAQADTNHLLFVGSKSVFMATELCNMESTLSMLNTRASMSTAIALRPAMQRVALYGSRLIKVNGNNGHLERG